MMRRLPRKHCAGHGEHVIAEARDIQNTGCANRPREKDVAAVGGAEFEFYPFPRACALVFVGAWSGPPRANLFDLGGVA